MILNITERQALFLVAELSERKRSNDFTLSKADLTLDKEDNWILKELIKQLREENVDILDILRQLGVSNE